MKELDSRLEDLQSSHELYRPLFGPSNTSLTCQGTSGAVAGGPPTLAGNCCLREPCSPVLHLQTYRLDTDRMRPPVGSWVGNGRGQIVMQLPQGSGTEYWASEGGAANGCMIWDSDSPLDIHLL